MNTCKTCRWWRDVESESIYENVKVCTCPKVEFARTTYRDYDVTTPPVATANDDGHVLSGDEVAVFDGSGYFAALMPGPDFGCIHWEEKQ